MTQTVAMRTTSLAASAALMSALVIAALTMSVSFIPSIVGPEGVIIRMEPLPPPTPPVTTPRPPAPPIERPIEGPTVSEPLPPIERPISDAGRGLVGAPQPETITRPRWVRTPSDLQGYYPRRPLTRAIEGDVVLDCLVTTTGALRCAVVSETPPSWGFADAALRISRDYQMVPAMRGGHVVEGRYRMRVPFRVE